MTLLSLSSMVTELKIGITKVEQLKEDEQRAIAKLLEEEIQWDKTLYSTQQQLLNLANEALEEYDKGKTQEKDW